MKQYIYLCGPTVYNKVHIGNMRPIVTFDLVLRGLKKINPNIEFIHNITDIDDKIINQAQLEKTTEEKIYTKYTNFYLKMLDEYNIKTIDHLPKVTENISLINDFIKEIKNKNFAYESNNSIYFNTFNLKHYGEVSNNKLDQLVSEDNLDNKKNPQDFALWKNKTNGLTWKTEFGSGRPGWHTECAAFIYKYTKGYPLLIHGGGIDLKFPHHENENAQFRSLTNNVITNNWKHIGIINFKNQKMSKSLGNIMYADDFLIKYSDEIIFPSDLYRLLILSSNYRSTIEISDQLIKSLSKKIKQLEKVIKYLILEGNLVDIDQEIIDKCVERLIYFDFSSINKELNQFLKEFNEKPNNQSASLIYKILELLGFKIVDFSINDSLIKMYKDWKELLKNKNFIEADKLREVLINNKII